MFKLLMRQYCIKQLVFGRVHFLRLLSVMAMQSPARLVAVVTFIWLVEFAAAEPSLALYNYIH